MKIKITMLVLSVFYCAYLLVLLAASHYESSVLNPLDSQYYYKKGLYEKAIEAEPSKAEYHMSYALDLARKNPAPDYFTARLVLSQLKQAVELRPFSKAYREIYNTYAPLSEKLTPLQTY
jgi:hypothetical protein